MKKKILKVLALVACAVLLVVGSIAGTLAYMTSLTGTVTNTFTVGNVAITLDELDVDEYGVAVPNADPARVMANAYKLVPGHKYVKDPTIHVAEGSEDCWLFVKVENGISAIEGGTTIAAQMATNGWTQLEVDGVAVENVYYHAVVDARTEAKDVKVFESFTLKTDANVASYVDNEGNVSETIAVTAYAVQADGFNTAAAAWAAAPASWN